MDQSDSVEQIKLPASEAFGKFKGKSLDAANVDFTDTIGIRRKTGYDVRSGEWEMLGSGSKEIETPQQTYHRLQYEIKELLELVTEMKKTSDEDSKSSHISPVMLASQVENLQRELQDLNMEQLLGSEAIADLSDPHGALQKKLLSQLENFKKTLPSDNKPKSSVPTSTSSDSVITYELYIKPEESKLKETARVADLEHRLKQVENLVGSDKNKLSLLTSNTSGKSLTSAIGLLTAKMNLLDPSHIDQIENRFVVLQQLLQQVSEKKQQVDDADKQNKIAELYELAKKVETMSTSLPQVVERLIALKDLHEQALQFSKALTQLDTYQQQISSGLQNNERLLKQLEGNFEKNFSTVLNNIGSLESRMSAFKK